MLLQIMIESFYFETSDVQGKFLGRMTNLIEIEKSDYREDLKKLPDVNLRSLLN